MIHAYIDFQRNPRFWLWNTFIERNVCDAGFRVALGPLRFGVFCDR